MKELTPVPGRGHLLWCLGGVNCADARARVLAYMLMDKNLLRWFDNVFYQGD